MRQANIAAIILAAGQSRRMGRPKMLLPWGGTTVLGQVLKVLAAALEADQGTNWEANKETESPTHKNLETAPGASRQMIVVTGGAREEVEGLISQLQPALAVQCVFNPQFEAGEMLSSLQRGLAELGPEAKAALIGLGDQPQVSLSAARKVVAAFESSGARLVIPSFQQRRGHPWLVRRDLWPEILALRTPQTLRDFLNAHGSEILYVECDESVLKDLDTPEQYLREKP